MKAVKEFDAKINRPPVEPAARAQHSLDEELAVASAIGQTIREID